MQRRPIVGIALMWLVGAMLSYAHSKSWLLIILGIMIVALLLLPRLVDMSRLAVVIGAVVILISYSYNMWFDSRNVSPLTAQFGYDIAGQDMLFTGEIVTPVNIDGDQVSFVLKTQHKEKLQVFIRLHEQLEQNIAKQWRRGYAIKLVGELQQPEPARNFGAFEYKRHLYYQHIHWIVQVKGLDGVIVEPNEAWRIVRLYEWTDAIREALGEKVAHIFSPMYEGFMKSLLIGLRDEVLPEQFEQFSLLGLTHIMAISGLHVAVFIAGCMALLRACRLTKETTLVVVMLLIPFYIVMTGAAPSVVRAGFMAIIGLYALRRNKLKDGLHIISIVGLGMLIYHPYYLFQISFQLSFIVTLGLMIGVPMLNRALPISSVYLRSTLSVTFIAQLFSFPLSIYYFNQFSLLSWLANLMLVPLISVVIIPFGMLALLISLISESIASFMAWLIDLMNLCLFYTVEVLNNISYVQLIWPSPSWWWIVGYYLLLIIFLRSLSNPTSSFIKYSLFLSMVGLCMLVLFAYSPDYFDRNGYVQFIDVGQGDAILIRTPERKIILIDGGGTLRFRKEGEQWKERRDPYEVGKKLLVPLLKKRGIHHIDYLISTHADYDHYGGLHAVINSIPVRRLVMNGTYKKNESYIDLLRSVLGKNIPIFQAEMGMTFDIDRWTTMTFLYPRDVTTMKEVSHQNHVSIVCFLAMRDYTFLFTGDIEQQAEREIVQLQQLGLIAGLPSAVDVLKIAHHGSKTSSTDTWLAYWQPRAAVIPVGKYNIYGHPHPTVIDRLQEYVESIYRTDLHGEIQMKVSDNAIQVRVKQDQL